MTFHAPVDPAHVSHSIVMNVGAQSNGFTAACRTIRLVMRELDHERIDVMKLNVEGAEDAILETVLRDGIEPMVIW